MKIAIDISQIIYGTGVSTYTKNLVKNLLELDKDNEYILFGGSLRGLSMLKRAVKGIPGKYSLVTFLIPPTLADLLWNRLRVFSIERLIGNIDVFHSSDWAQPPTRAFKVTTIHDLVPLKYPELSHPRIVGAHKMRLAFVKKEVDRIIVPSRQTKEDMIEEGVSQERIRVIPEAPDPIFEPSKKLEIERVKRKYTIKGKYLLAVGISPRKNTQRIIQAFEKMGREGEDLKLILAGKPIKMIEKTPGAITIGHVPLQDLPALYSGAEALVYPSLYEGFGLPILEAFACATPVVTSNLGSMKEICENAAVLVDPENPNSIADGIIEAIKTRNALVNKGTTQVKKFSWQKTAKETLKVYRELC